MHSVSLPNSYLSVEKSILMEADQTSARQELAPDEILDVCEMNALPTRGWVASKIHLESPRSHSARGQDYLYRRGNATDVAPIFYGLLIRFF